MSPLFIRRNVNGTMATAHVEKNTAGQSGPHQEAIQVKQQEIKDLELEAKQAEQAIKALG